jgi:hypothetical protein
MRFFIIILFSFLLFSFWNEHSNVIIWNEARALTWSDFKGKPARRFSVASTNYDIIKSIFKKGESTLEINIKAVFFKKKSWKKKGKVNDLVLIHEQKHFDIVELFARKLRKKIISCNYLSYKDCQIKIDSLYNQNDKAMDVYQDKYDYETDGSLNGNMQRQWNIKIDNELKKLQAFKDNSFQVILNQNNYSSYR